MTPEWNTLPKHEGEGTYRTLPELARQLEHERSGGAYRSREQQLTDEGRARNGTPELTGTARDEAIQRLARAYPEEYDRGRHVAHLRLAVRDAGRRLPAGEPAKRGAVPMSTRQDRCATAGHANIPATHEVTWSDRSDRTELFTDRVCGPCADSYTRRPSLQATAREITRRPKRGRSR